MSLTLCGYLSDATLTHSYGYPVYSERTLLGAVYPSELLQLQKTGEGELDANLDISVIPI